MIWNASSLLPLVSKNSGDSGIFSIMSKLILAVITVRLAKGKYSFDKCVKYIVLKIGTIASIMPTRVPTKVLCF